MRLVSLRNLIFNFIQFLTRVLWVVTSHCGFILHFPNDQRCQLSCHVFICSLYILFGKVFFRWFSWLGGLCSYYWAIRIPIRCGYFPQFLEVYLFIFPHFVNCLLMLLVVGFFFAIKFILKIVLLFINFLNVHWILRGFLSLFQQWELKRKSLMLSSSPLYFY